MDLTFNVLKATDSKSKLHASYIYIFLIKYLSISFTWHNDRQNPYYDIFFIKI